MVAGFELLSWQQGKYAQSCIFNKLLFSTEAEASKQLKIKIRKYHQQKAWQITDMRNNKGPNTEPCEPALGNFQFEE